MEASLGLPLLQTNHSEEFVGIAPVNVCLRELTITGIRWKMGIFGSEVSSSGGLAIIPLHFLHASKM